MLARPSVMSTRRKASWGCRAFSWLQQFPGQVQGVGQGGLATGGQMRQVPLGHLDAVGEGQGQLGLAAPEDDEPHPLPLLVGVDQERQDRGLGFGHADVGAHGAGGVHHEEDVAADALLPHLVAQVGLADGQGQVAALPQPLVRAPRPGGWRQWPGPAVRSYAGWGGHSGRWWSSLRARVRLPGAFLGLAVRRQIQGPHREGGPRRHRHFADYDLIPVSGRRPPGWGGGGSAGGAAPSPPGACGRFPPACFRPSRIR